MSTEKIKNVSLRKTMTRNRWIKNGDGRLSTPGWVKRMNRNKLVSKIIRVLWWDNYWGDYIFLSQYKTLFIKHRLTKYLTFVSNSSFYFSLCQRTDEWRVERESKSSFSVFHCGEVVKTVSVYTLRFVYDFKTLMNPRNSSSLYSSNIQVPEKRKTQWTMVWSNYGRVCSQWCSLLIVIIRLRNVYLRQTVIKSHENSIKRGTSECWDGEWTV